MLNKKIFLLENFLVQSFCLHFLMDFFTMNINESNRLEQKLKALATTKKGEKDLVHNAHLIQIDHHIESINRLRSIKVSR